MQLIANLISKFGFFIFFLFLEGIAIFFTVTKSDFHKTFFGEKMLSVNGHLSEQVSFITHFKNLPIENESLLKENARLKNYIKNHNLSVKDILKQSELIDSTHQRNYKYTTAQIVDYSLRKKDNYFYINKGKKDGIKEDMAILSPHGVVGAVLTTANHYSSVIPLIHSKSNLKAKVKGLNYYGIIRWNGEDYRKLSLQEIPKYLNVKKGDTILTAGESAIYPEGELIGRITQIQPNNKTGDFEIEVTPFDDLSEIKNVYVVENLNKEDLEKAKEGEADVSE